MTNISPPPKVGGYVLFGNNAGTIRDAVDALLSLCDEVVGIDSGATDGSAALVENAGVRVARHAWRGFGAARAAAVRELPSCDYIFFLDSDESIDATLAQSIARWRKSDSRKPYYQVARRDWFIGENPFVFRQEYRKRLVRRDCASWSPSMIVHEALPSGPHGRLEGFIEHRFADETGFRSLKEERYALLWGVAEHCAGRRRAKNADTQRIWHFVRNALVKGAAVRGGLRGVALSWQTSRYHQQKYRYLRRIQSGEFPELVALCRSERFGELFALVNAAEPGDGGLALA